MSCLKSHSSAASLEATAKGVLSRVTYELVHNRHQLSSLANIVAKVPDLEEEISKLWSVTILLSQVEDIRKKIMENDSSRPARVYACYCVKFFNFLKDSTASLANSINRELRKEGVTARDFCLFISRIYRKASLRAPVPARELTTAEIKEGLKMYGFTGVSPPKCVDVLKRVWNRSIRRTTRAFTSSSSSSDSSDSSSFSDDSLSSSDLSSSGFSTSSGSTCSTDSSTSPESSDSSDWNRYSRKRSRRSSLTRSSGSNRNLRKRSRRRSPVSDSRSNRHLRRRSDRRSSTIDAGSNRNQRRRSARGSWTVMNRESSSDN